MKPQRTYRIVVGVDFSEMSQVVIETAFDTAARHQAPELHIVSVLEPAGRVLENAAIAPDGEFDELENQLKALVEDKMSDFGISGDSHGDWTVILHARHGPVVSELVDLAWEVEADIIVVGRHGGPRRWLSKSGDIPRNLLQKTRCPVLVVQPTDYGLYEDLDEQRARQCPKCVAIRRDTQGQSWFCKEHQDYKLSRRIYMAHSSGTWPIGGGPLL